MSGRMNRKARFGKAAAVTRGGAGQTDLNRKLWQLPDCAASLDLHNILASAVEGGVLDSGGATRALLCPLKRTPPMARTRQLKRGRGSRQRTPDMPQATPTPLEQALPQHIQHVRAAATTASAKAAAPSVHANTLGVHIPAAWTEPRNALDTHRSIRIL